MGVAFGSPLRVWLCNVAGVGAWNGVWGALKASHRNHGLAPELAMNEIASSTLSVVAYVV